VFLDQSLTVVVGVPLHLVGAGVRPRPAVLQPGDEQANGLGCVQRDKRVGSVEPREVALGGVLRVCLDEIAVRVGGRERVVDWSEVGKHTESVVTGDTNNHIRDPVISQI